jgi:5-methylcytosine-specific restriction protein A
VSGDKYRFRKRDGSFYSEGHHVVPLGGGGTDDPRNIIIVNPLIHRMLHFAKVEGLHLSKIVELSDGSATLDFTINDEPFTITWKPGHAAKVLEHQQAT